MRAVVALLFLILLGTCGAGSTPPAPECGDGGCACSSGKLCSFTWETCGGGYDDGGGTGTCALSCSNHTNCGGYCLDGCSVDCSGGSTCTLSVGAGATVVCTGASTTCHVTCWGACQVACKAAQCDLRCGDESPFQI